MLSEVTVQEQGVEIYQMMRKQLYIENNLNDLDMSMNNLRDVSESTNDRLERRSDEAEDKKIDFISIGLALMFITEPLSMLFSGNNDNRVQSIIWSIMTLVFITVILVIAFKNNIIEFKNKKKE